MTRTVGAIVLNEAFGAEPRSNLPRGVKKKKLDRNRCAGHAAAVGGCRGAEDGFAAVRTTGLGAANVGVTAVAVRNGRQNEVLVADVTNENCMTLRSRSDVTRM